MNKNAAITPLIIAAVLALGVGWSAASYGQSQNPTDSLDGVLLDQYNNDVERLAAQANQSAFNELNAACNPLGDLDFTADPTGPGQGADLTLCAPAAFDVYLTIREIVHTANELLQNGGPVVASLGVDLEGLGTTLRWTAAEELAAQGSAATEFTNSQLSNLASRLNALRFGARGFSVAGFHGPSSTDGTLVASAGGLRRGGGASADAVEGTYSAWGGFLNGSFGYGSKSDTDLENAFDFDGSEVTMGLDYRFQNNFVLGGIVGYKKQNIDFDEAASAIRVTDGSMEVEGFSGIMFGLYQGDQAFVSGSVGYEKLDYFVDRRIKYGSNNPNVGAANSIAISRPEGDVLTGTFSFGYAMHKNRFTFEPYVNAEYMDVTIDAFDEERSIDASSGFQDDDRFNLTIAEQSFDSLNVVAGAKFQYTFTPNAGVIIPYAKVESHNEVLNEARIIRAGYGELRDIQESRGILTFSVPTDAIDKSFWTWSVGFSMVLRGGRQRTYDGPITGGLMGFVQYESIENLRNYEEQIISGGFRYEF